MAAKKKATKKRAAKKKSGAKRKPSISLVMYVVKEKGGLFGVEFYSVECVGVLVAFGK